MNRIRLIWEIVVQSRMNAFQSLLEFHHDDAKFMVILQQASLKYPDCPEFRIALAFAEITSGHYCNGLAHFRAICTDQRTPNSYTNILFHVGETWTRMAYTPFESVRHIVNPHNRGRRAVKFLWNVPLRWVETSGLADRPEEFVALMTIPLGVNESIGSSLTRTSALMERVKMDFIGTLVSDHWGTLGTKVLHEFAKLLKQIFTELQVCSTSLR